MSILLRENGNCSPLSRTAGPRHLSARILIVHVFQRSHHIHCLLRGKIKNYSESQCLIVSSHPLLLHCNKLYKPFFIFHLFFMWNVVLLVSSSFSVPAEIKVGYLMQLCLLSSHRQCREQKQSISAVNWPHLKPLVTSQRAHGFVFTLWTEPEPKLQTELGRADNRVGPNALFLGFFLFSAHNMVLGLFCLKEHKLHLFYVVTLWSELLLPLHFSFSFTCSLFVQFFFAFSFYFCLLFLTLSSTNSESFRPLLTPW